MTKFPSLKPREIERVLLKHGFREQRQTGSHRTFYNPQTGKVAVVPFHNKDVAPGTLRSIIKQSGLPEDTFLNRGNRK